MKAALPNGRLIGPLILRQFISLPPGASVYRELTQFVPHYAPAGNYIYIGYAGDYSGVILDSSGFTFEKLPGEIFPPAHNRGWALAGWGEYEEESIDLELEVPSEYKFHPPFPNPFNEQVLLFFSLAEAVNVSLVIYDVMGREIAVMVDDYRPAGRYELFWDSAGACSGVYFARLIAGDFTQTRKMLLVK